MHDQQIPNPSDFISVWESNYIGNQKVFICNSRDKEALQ